MSIGKLGQVVRSAIDRSPGSVQRLIDKVRGPPSPSELDIKSLVESQDDLVEKTEEISELDDRKLQKLCNISGLKHHHRADILGLPRPLPTLEKFAYPAYRSFHYQRRIYARHGSASNVHPGKLWPSPEELAVKQEKSRLCFMMTAEDVLQEAKRAKEEDELKARERRERDEDIAANMVKVEAMKEQLYKEAVQFELEADKAQERKEKRIEQVRKFFSYTLNVKDPRFKEKMQEMVQSEKDRERKVAKDAKKKKFEEQKEAQEKNS